MEAAALTRELLAPSGPAVDDSARLAVRRRLVSTLAPLVELLPAGTQVVLTLPLLRRARTDTNLLSQPDEPFAWKPAFVRRSLGLAVVSACASGRFRTPAAAVGPVADEAVAEWHQTGWRTYHWEPWLAGLATGARAMVLADALTWSTSLWSAFDWTGFAVAPQIGGIDDQWVCPAVRTMRLKARAELRVALPPAPERPGGPPATALVVVSGGSPSPGWTEDLAYLALVAGLRSPARNVPARVMGLWPDAGLHATVPIDPDALERAVDQVVSTVTAVVESRVPEADRAA